MNTQIVAKNLVKTFTPYPHLTVEAVRGVNLSLQTGEVLLIMGPSGSGKTTLLSILGCLLHPSSGYLELAGRDVSTLGSHELVALRRACFGFVFQNHLLIDALTVAENVELTLNLMGQKRPASRLKTLQLLEDLGLGSRTSFFPKRLSGGERQRVAIARALVTNPPFLLADEPTGSLDPEAREKVLGMLKEAAKLHNKGVLIVSHDLRLKTYADRILSMKDGRIVEAPNLEY